MNFSEEFVRSFEIGVFVVAVVRLIIAVILGGIIGWEREHNNRPAGLRTHVVVCTGSALIMLLSDYMGCIYGVQMDPARMGAQVISGIGFLGAGTIIKEGFSVKGLTTAASLWVVSCIGLVVGVGFYSGAIIATVLLYCTLIMMKHVQIFRVNTCMICLWVTSVDEVYCEVAELVKRYKCNIVSAEIVSSPDCKTKELRIEISMPEEKERIEDLLLRLRMLEAVKAQHIE